MALGIAQEEATAIFVSNDDAALRATIELVEERMRSTKAPPVDSPAAYFKSALRNRFASPREVAQKTLTAAPAVSAPERGPTLRERFAAKRTREAAEYFNEIDASERDQLLLEFEPEAPRVVATSLRRSGLQSKVAQSAFFSWLATRLWGEATDKDLLAYAESAL